MKKKFVKKMVCMAMACVFMVQAAPMLSNAASLNENESTSTTYAAERMSDTELVFNALMRYMLFGVIYETTGRWGQLQFYDLQSISVKEISPELGHCVMQFLCKDAGGWTNMTVVIMIGSGTYWKDYTSSWTYYLYAGHELASIGLGIAASVGGVGLDVTENRINNCTANLWALRTLRKQAQAMAPTNTLYYVPVMICTQGRIGTPFYTEEPIQSGVVLGDNMSFPSVEQDFTTETLPDWIFNGPAINFR